MPSLFDPIQLGAIDAPNRILMAPLTRGRATREHVPTPIMADYYRPARRRRADHLRSDRDQPRRARLALSRRACGPRSRSRRWKPVTEAVHEAGGRIVAQLWHMGRLVHPDFLDGDAAGLVLGDHRARHARIPMPASKPYAEARAADARRDRRACSTIMRRPPRNAIARRVRRRPAPRRQWLSDRPVPARQFEPPRRRLWRLARESHPAAPRSRCERVIAARRRRPHRGPPLAQRRDAGRRRQRSARRCSSAAAAALDDLGIAFLELREPGPDGTFGRTDVPKLSPADPQGVQRPAGAQPGLSRRRSAQAELDAGARRRDRLRAPLHRQSRSRRAASARRRRSTPTIAGPVTTPGPEGYIDYPALGRS